MRMATLGNGSCQAVEDHKVAVITDS